jgi:hypothetical protein
VCHLLRQREVLKILTIKYIYSKRYQWKFKLKLINLMKRGWRKREQRKMVCDYWAYFSLSFIAPCGCVPNRFSSLSENIYQGATKLRTIYWVLKDFLLNWHYWYISELIGESRWACVLKRLSKCGLCCEQGIKSVIKNFRDWLCHLVKNYLWIFWSPSPSKQSLPRVCTVPRASAIFNASWKACSVRVFSTVCLSVLSWIVER